MTGYANGSFKLDSSVSLSVEIRALNNRYLDLNIRLDDDLKYLEAKLNPCSVTQLEEVRSNVASLSL